jgi:hypothetical protein
MSKIFLSAKLFKLSKVVTHLDKMSEEATVSLWADMAQWIANGIVFFINNRSDTSAIAVKN